MKLKKQLKKQEKWLRGGSNIIKGRQGARVIYWGESTTADRRQVRTSGDMEDGLAESLGKTKQDVLQMLQKEQS